MKYSLILFLFIVFSCNSADQSVSDSNAFQPKHAISLDQEENIEDISEAMEIQKMLIKTGYIEFQVNDVEEKHQEILNSLDSSQAYVVNDQSFTTKNRIQYSMQIRIPKQHYESFITKILSGVERVDNKSISVQDVTEEFVDIQARLKTKKQLEQRYLELLGQASSVADMLEIEKQIGDLQSDIESIEGRIKFLQQQVSYSTLNLNFYEKISVGNRFDDKFKDGFKNGWNNLIWFFVGLVNIWPFIFLFVLSIFLFIRLKRRNRKKRQP